MNNIHSTERVYPELVFKVLHLKKLILLLFVFFLPFSQALTINLFFPLKISEIGIFLFFGFLLIELTLEKNVSFKTDYVKGYLLLFIGIVLISTFANFFKSYNYPLDLSNVRINKTADSLLKFVYLLLAFIAMQITINLINTFGKQEVLKWFFIGAVISSLYSWYLFTSGILHIPEILLPGMDDPPQSLNLSFGQIIRCGTFKEGNYMGLFLFLTGVIARHEGKNNLSIFLFATTLTTFSTVSFVCIFAYFIFSSFSNRRTFIKAVIGFLIALSVLGVLIVRSDDFRSNVVNKIFASEDEVDNPNDVVSRLDRLNTTQIGLNIFLDNPLLGVGTANYGLHFEHYNLLPKFGEGDYKRIPNNVYIEVLSESGLIAFVLFLGLVVIIIKQSINTRSTSLIVGTVIGFIYLVAFPTYTMLYIWFYWGFILTEAKYPNTQLQNE